MTEPGKILEKIKEHIEEKPYVKTRKDPFKVLISTILSQRTKDKNTRKASEQLFSNFKNAEKLSKANLKKLEKIIKPAGFYRVKSKRIKKVSKILLEKYKGKVPQTKKQLLKLPGVGRKTANIVLSFAFNKDVISVDTHVHRISNRIGLVNTEKPEQTEQQLMKKIKRKYWKQVNPILVRFGQQTCRPRNPKCPKCPVKKWCEYYENLYKENEN